MDSPNSHQTRERYDDLRLAFANARELRARSGRRRLKGSNIAKLYLVSASCTLGVQGSCPSRVFTCELLTWLSFGPLSERRMYVVLMYICTVNSRYTHNLRAEWYMQLE